MAWQKYILVVVFAGCSSTPDPVVEEELPPITVRDLPADRFGTETPSACSGVAETGSCSQGILLTCDPRTEEVRRTNCTEMNMLCVSKPTGSECSNPGAATGEPPPEIEEDPLCGGITAEGSCNASGTAIWCNPEEGVVEWPCSDYGLRCEMTDDGAFCVGETSTECDALGFEGECSGNVARYCVGETLYEVNCDESSTTCQYDQCVVGAGCCEVVDESECERLGYYGECLGNVARYCIDGIIHEDDCGEWDRFCELDTCEDGAYCCEPDEVIDECDGLDSQGRCTGTGGLEYCIAGSLVQETCEEGTTCVDDLYMEGWAVCCTDEDLCEALDFGGICGGPDENTVIDCIEGTIYVEECSLEDPCMDDMIYGVSCGDWA